MKYYILAGEASGDLHGAELIKELQRQDSSAEIRFWGGDLMAAAGGRMVKHYRDLAFMGFAEVLFNLKTILRNIKLCKKDISDFQPDAIIFIDYPGFNMRIAKWAKEKGFPTHYYISPQIWAWKENRITAIKRDVDHMYVILPFEKDFYENKHNYKVEFVGHPLLDVINKKRDGDFSEFRLKNNLSEKPIIALLPGSRKQEITKMLSVMTSVADLFLDYQFIIAGAPGQEDSFYEQFLTNKNILFVSNQTYNLLSISHAALVTSGTATLETALFKVPEVVCYKGNWASYQIAKRIITLKYISLVNLIMDRLVVEELIQDDFNKKSLTNALEKILNKKHRETILEDYNLLEESLGRSGAARKTAEKILQSLR